MMSVEPLIEKLMRWHSLRDEVKTGEDICTHQIVEARLSRMLSFIQDNDKEFAFLSAYRTGRSDAENIKNNRKIRMILDSKKMGVYAVVGHWWEKADGDERAWEDIPKEEMTETFERTWVTIKPDDMPSDEFRELIFELVEDPRWLQDAVLLKVGDEPAALYNAGSRSKIVDVPDLTLGTMAQAYSQHVRKLQVPFVFEGVEVPVGNRGKELFNRQGFRW